MKWSVESRPGAIGTFITGPFELEKGLAVFAIRSFLTDGRNEKAPVLREFFDLSWWLSQAPDFVGWMLTVLAMSLIALPLTTTLFRPLAARGAALAILVGPLVTAWVIFIASHAPLWSSHEALLSRVGPLLAGFALTALLASRLNAQDDEPTDRRIFLPFLLLSLPALVPIAHHQTGILLAVLLLAAASLLCLPTLLFLGNGRLKQIGIDYASGVGLFATAFLLFLGVRSYTPWITYDINLYAAEKWGNFAHLQAVIGSAQMPPTDLWYFGQPTNYYYGGHFLTATFAKLLGVDAGIAFNLGIATVVGFSAAGAYVAGQNLAQWSIHYCSRKTAYAAGLVCSLAVPFFGNLHSVFQALRGDGRWTAASVSTARFDHRLESEKARVGLPPSAMLALADFHQAQAGIDEKDLSGIRTILTIKKEQINRQQQQVHQLRDRLELIAIPLARTAGESFIFQFRDIDQSLADFLENHSGLHRLEFTENLANAIRLGDTARVNFLLDKLLQPNAFPELIDTWIDDIGSPELLDRQLVGLVSLLQRWDREARVPPRWRIDFWGPSRAIKGTPRDTTEIGTITEFPAFSTLLGDHHPHHTAVPYALLIIAGLLQLFRVLLLGRGLIAIRYSALVATLLGAVFFVNTWDAVVFAGVLTIGLVLLGIRAALNSPARKSVLPLLGHFGLVTTVSLLCSFTFLSNFESPLRPMIPLRDPSGHQFWNPILTEAPRAEIRQLIWATSPIRSFPKELRSELSGFLTHWGLFLLPVLILFVKVTRLDRRGTLIALGIGIALLAYSLAQSGHLLPALLSILFGLAIRSAVRDQLVIAMILLAGVFFWFLFCEFLIFDDDYVGFLERYNTVFKVTYPLWSIMGVVAGVSMIRITLFLWQWTQRIPLPTLTTSFCLAVVFLALIWVVSSAGYSMTAFVLFLFVLIPVLLFLIFELLNIQTFVPHFTNAELLTGYSRSAIAAFPLFIFLVMGLHYPIAGSISRSHGFFTDPSMESLSSQLARQEPLRIRTLDGLKHFYSHRFAADIEMGHWIEQNLAPGTMILEFGTEAAYTPAGRISSFAARPTALNWLHHQEQWRGRQGEIPPFLEVFAIAEDPFRQRGFSPISAARRRFLELLSVYYEAPEMLPELPLLLGAEYLVIGTLERENFIISPRFETDFKLVHRTEARGQVTLLYRIRSSEEVAE